MSKKFHSYPDVVQWKVEYVFQYQSVINIFLKPVTDQPLSIAMYARTQSKKESFYLRPFYVVDVDFGFHSMVYDVGGEKGDNHNYSSTLLPGELYKRRPCIILRAEGKAAQVIPLTTQRKSESDPKSIAISEESFDKLFFRYREKKSSALIHMIQTVSSSRIFPPKSINGSYSRSYIEQKITKEDQDKIELALAELHSKKAITEREILSRQVDDERKQKFKVLAVNEKLKEDILIKNQQVDDLTGKLLKIGQYLDLGNDIDEIMNNFK
ncbi:type II toxin-antitoxin system PemK/MazF family toxin [Photobacterium leiognathi]|nr:type II toxin-antitoxin system PemK/MazF family toxin [Photobacterium leiognathi]